MSDLYGNDEYIQNAIATTRTIQENVSIIQGASGYGRLVSLIDYNIEKIDNMAEYISFCVAQNSSIKLYQNQYGDSLIKGHLKRNFCNEQKAEDNQVIRRNIALLESAFVEYGIKWSVRGIQKWAENKDRAELFNQIYSILYCFVQEDKDCKNQRRTLIELKKIREAFPIADKDKKAFASFMTNKDVTELELSRVVSSDNSQILEGVAYCLYALYAQKYNEMEEKENILLDYYSVLGYLGKYADEVLRENRNAYNEIASDQIKYLKIARGMVQNFDICLPMIDRNKLTQRAIKMSEYDPYYISTAKKNKNMDTRKKKRISDIFFENPEIVMHAGITATSQLELDDDSKENVRNRFIEWGLDGKSTDSILEQTEKIQTDLLE